MIQDGVLPPSQCYPVASNRIVHGLGSPLSAIDSQKRSFRNPPNHKLCGLMSRKPKQPSVTHRITTSMSDFSSLDQEQRILPIDAEISDSVLDLGVTK